MENIVNFGLVHATIVGQIIVIALLIQLFKERGGKEGKLTKLVADNATLLSFIVVVGALVGSLIYSEVVGFDPCKLCWWQRVFMYPQFFLLGAGVLWKKRDILPYTAVLSIFGAITAVYHYITQRTGWEVTNCSLGGGPSCAGYEFMAYGYITIPIMSLTAFLLVLATYLCYKKYASRENLY
mgnify:CR=1 FL=1